MTRYNKGEIMNTAHFLRRKYDITISQEALGHGSAGFTLDVYGHVTPQMKRSSAARMESFIKGIQKHA